MEEAVSLTLRSTGIKGRRLASLYPGVTLSAQYRTELDTFEMAEVIAMAELRADPEALARRIIRRIFELFNWNDPEENMLHNWQQKLMQRTY